MKKYLSKIKGGKLLIIKINVNKKRIKKLQLLGDFFLYPEEKILLIENSLINAHQNNYASLLRNIIKQEKIILLGIGIEDIILLIHQAFIEKQNER